MKVIETWGEIGKEPYYRREYEFNVTAEQILAALEFVLAEEGLAQKALIRGRVFVQDYLEK